MRFRYLAAVLAVAALVALPAVAQEQRGSIEGAVKDAQGGAVVGATVTAQLASALETKGERVYGPGIGVVTDANGTYRFASLAPGRYLITATVSGFAPAKVQNIDLRLGQQLNIPLTLSPGGLAETVQVVASRRGRAGPGLHHRPAGKRGWTAAGGDRSVRPVPRQRSYRQHAWEKRRRITTV